MSLPGVSKHLKVLRDAGWSCRVAMPSGGRAISGRRSCATSHRGSSSTAGSGRSASIASTRTFARSRPRSRLDDRTWNITERPNRAPLDLRARAHLPAPAPPGSSARSPNRRPRPPGSSVPKESATTGHALDFRVGGREHASARACRARERTRSTRPTTTSCPTSASSTAYEMTVDGRRISASLASIELLPRGGGTHLTVTEHGIYLDGLDRGRARARDARAARQAQAALATAPGVAATAARPDDGHDRPEATRRGRPPRVDRPRRPGPGLPAVRHGPDGPAPGRPVDQRGPPAEQRPAALDHRHLRLHGRGLPRSRWARSATGSADASCCSSAPPRSASLSILAAFSTSAEMLIAQPRPARHRRGDARAVDPVAHLQHVPGPAASARVAIAVWISAFSAGSAIGPVVGGVLLEHFWWGSVFLLALPVMAAAARPRADRPARVQGPGRRPPRPRQRRPVARRRPGRDLRPQADRPGRVRPAAGRDDRRRRSSSASCSSGASSAWPTR